MTRWTRRLLLGAIVALVPALAGCEAGLNAPTLTFHQAANGAYASHNGVFINNAFVLGAAGPTRSLPAGGRAGVFLSLHAEDGDRLMSVTAPGTAASVEVAGAPVRLAPQTQVLLTGPSPQVVMTGLTRPLQGGEAVPMIFTFARAGAITLQVPVMSRADEYATYSPPARATPTASPRVTGTGSVSPSATATSGGNNGPNPTSSPKPTTP